MNDKNNQIIIYSTEDGKMKLEVKLENETVWLSQVQMAELFNCGVANINLHLKNVFNEAELSENQTIKEYLIVQKEGNKEVKRPVNLYNLDAIISVGYRINSLRGTQFRIWATQKLKEYIIKWFVMDDERLAGGKVAKSYFQELKERIRKIRTSEANFYQKVRDIFALSVDYSPKTDYAQKFFAMVQNKFHYAISGLTDAEIVNSRIDSSKENLGLTNWPGEIITREQAEIAKNYLEELELKRLNLLVEQFLSFAELQSVKERLMYMRDWVNELNEFLIFNKEKVLNNAGAVSRDDMEEKVRLELAKYNQKRLKK
ncbi:MAG: virulence RhuM family protein [Candidatus Falkowbacteria bacterium]|nr:virulence RhuM family protein [Candidatus Falkowbacteria bacterium]